MSDISPTPTNAYITDGELMAWLGQKSAEQYGELRDIMNMSNQRGDLMKDLADLKADIDADKPDEAIVAEMDALSAKYAGTPYADELNGLSADMHGRLETDKAARAIDVQITDTNNKLKDPSLSPGTREQLEAKKAKLEADLKAVQPQVGFKETFSPKLESLSDQLGRIDQLELIKIQETVSDAQQTDQLASNIIANRDQTSNGIVGNIRG